MRVLEELRKRRVFNPYGFYGRQPYIWYMPRGDSRSMTVAGWRVTRHGTNLDSDWYQDSKDSKHFYIFYPPYDPSKYTERQRSKIGKDNALRTAMEWASEKFAVEGWVRDPFGGYGPRGFVERRLKEILAAPEGTDLEAKA